MKELRLGRLREQTGRILLRQKSDHTCMASLLPSFHSAEESLTSVVRTMKGGAQTVAAAIDWEEWPEIGDLAETTQY